MKTPLFTASSIAELGSATLILDSERRHIADANSGPDAQFIVRACNSHAQLVAALEKLVTEAIHFRGTCIDAKHLNAALDAANAALSAAQE